MKTAGSSTACRRVVKALDEALSEGVLNLPPELAAHAAQCPRCGPEVTETEELLARLRKAAAGISLSEVPHVVDYVMAHTAADYRNGPAVGAARAEEGSARRAHLRWVLGQAAAVAAVLLLTLAVTAYAGLKIHQVVSGNEPARVLTRLIDPFTNSERAEVPPAR